MSYCAIKTNCDKEFVCGVGVVSTVAGGGGSSLSGYVDGVGSLARFCQLSGISALSTGDVVVADTNNQIIRKITSSGSTNSYICLDTILFC